VTLVRIAPGDAARHPPAVTMRTGARVAAFEQAAGRVRVRLAANKGLDGAPLIGAGGLWSKIRTAAVGDGKPRAFASARAAGREPTEEPPEHP